MKAIWNGQILAESNDTVLIEGNHYFPADAINRDYFEESTTKTTCPWKGIASYYNIRVKGSVNKDAAWYYPEPFPLSRGIKGRVAFWKGVEIINSK